MPLLTVVRSTSRGLIGGNDEGSDTHLNDTADTGDGVRVTG